MSDPSMIFCDFFSQSSLCDLFLIDRKGNVIFSRVSSDTSPKKVYSLISREDVDFIDQRIECYEPKPFILAWGKIGPIFIARSLFPCFHQLFAIIPRFSEDQVIELSRLYSQYILLAPSAQSYFADDSRGATVEESHKLFFSALYDLFFHVKLYKSEERSAPDIVNEIKKKLSGFSYLWQCDIRVAFEQTVFDFEPEARFSMETFLFVLVYVGFMTLTSSETKRLNLLFYGSEKGIYFDAFFKLSPSITEISNLPELRELRASSWHRIFVFNTGIDQEHFVSRCFPFERDPHKMGLKCPLFFDYDN